MNFFRNIVTISAVLIPLTLAGVAGAAPLKIYDGKINSGWDMGLDSEKGMKTWTTINGEGICLNYPGGQKWGAMFITNGKPSDLPRPGKDLSAYRKVSFELKGKTGKEAVMVGIKDNTDPDNGKESRVTVKNVPTAWKKYEFPLSSFKTADLKNIYVPLELVFDKTATNLCVRSIQYLE